MKIAYLIPNVLITKVECKKREALLNKWAFPGTEVHIITFDDGPGTVECRYEEIICIPNMAKKAVELEQQGYDAVISGCAEDPGLEVIRELLTKTLVVGPGQTSMLVAASLGARFSVISTDNFNINIWHELAYKAGVSAKLYSVKPLNSPVTDFFSKENRQRILSRIVEIAKKEIEAGHIDTLILGCMSLGYLDMGADIEQALGIQVINSPKTVVKFTEALVGCGLVHSKLAYCTPKLIKEGKSMDEFMLKRTE